MTTAKRANEDLWQKIKKQVQKGTSGGPAGKWTARKAQLAVKKYKDAGGKYIGRPRKDNSLKKWTAEEWDYVDGKPGNRYLPKKVRKTLTKKEKAATNRAKRKGDKRGAYKTSYADWLKERFV